MRKPSPPPTGLKRVGSGVRISGSKAEMWRGSVQTHTQGDSAEGPEGWSGVGMWSGGCRARVWVWMGKPRQALESRIGLGLRLGAPIEKWLERLS